MQSEERNADVDKFVSEGPEAKADGTEIAGQPLREDTPPKTARPGRKDKGTLHAPRHRMLSRPLLEALSRRGENVRQLRQAETALREELQPQGIISEILFDRMWSSYLRCLLIVRSESRVLTKDRLPETFDLSYLPQGPKQHTPPFTFDDISRVHLEHLALIQRYDAHFAREFCRAAESLIARRDNRLIPL